jgi:hypothetical protein
MFRGAAAVPRYCVAGSFSLIIIIGGILGVIRNNNNSYGRWAWRDRNNFSELIHCCISQRREEEVKKKKEGNKEETYLKRLTHQRIRDSSTEQALFQRSRSRSQFHSHPTQTAWESSIDP